ncbi:hypothetical protein CHGG_01899 [Chaetomium globosum CBS 148.51]|uniref:DUF7707 domain-containing protein n=1 Tax=Chaetomium globosum (strain ATCC 6205 / CBS 148.51 / DSM 1962 / NBRC 6347 / NRRL 1970) TaxID=306901 RepID=Q2HD05_CHAGB|nr:uncharacterized protein CHGG_01899 [Chaetomium globosum CBS 148.51]EAQ93664.1 hypothetical protein CHGG_01899 [Chaetomium globosum CBS 148.51]
MVSFRTTFLAFMGAVAVSADYWVDPETVPDYLKTTSAACASRFASKLRVAIPRSTPAIPETLTYGCVCSDGKQPNVTEYTLTLPYHVCTAWGTACVADCGSNNKCASDCREKHPCGAQTPTRVNDTSSTTAAVPAATSTAPPADQAYDGLADGSGGNNDDDKNAAGSLRFANSYGLAVVAGGLFAGFAVLL